MKTKINLRLDSETLRKVRTILAEDGISISEFLTTKLHEIIRRRKTYARSKKRALARLRNCPSLGWVRPASRDELHER
jgi:hypothetical protein